MREGSGRTARVRRTAAGIDRGPSRWVWLVGALAVSVVAAACGGADAGAPPASAAPAPCDATMELARAVMEGVGYAVADLAVSACERGAAVVSVQPDGAACAGMGIECERAWVFLEDSGEHDWWSLGYAEGRFDCGISEAVESVCERLGLQSGQTP